MRLSTIKLAGFKSFVDPAVLHLPSNLHFSDMVNQLSENESIHTVRTRNV